MRLRLLRPVDYDQLVSLWDRAGLPYRPKGRDSRASIEEQMSRAPGGFLGAFVDGLLVGAVIATFEGRKGWINHLAVDPEHRRRGVATALVRAAEGELRGQGARVVAALVEEPNQASLALFEHLGYRIHRDVLYLSKREGDEV